MFLAQISPPIGVMPPELYEMAVDRVEEVVRKKKLANQDGA